METKRTAWMEVADRVLSVFMQDKSLWEYGFYELAVNATDFPPDCRDKLYKVVNRLHISGKMITDASVYAEDNSLDLYWIQQTWILCDQLEREALSTYVSKLKEFGQRYRFMHAAQAFADKLRVNNCDMGKEVSRLQQALSTNFAKPIEESTGTSLAAKIKAKLNSVPPAVTSTGLKWLDTILAGGYHRREVLAIGGKYKGGKTRLAQHMVIGALESGGQVTFAGYENQQLTYAYNLVAMLAVRYLRSKGWHEETFTQNGKQYRLDSFYGKLLATAGNRYKTWDKRMVEAIECGWDEFSAYGKRVRVYDQSDSGGGLYDVASLERLIMRDQLLYGGSEHHIIFADHINLMSKAIDYKDMPQIVGTLINLSQRYNATIVALSQMTQEALKSKSTGNAIGSMGGGSLPSGVHAYMRVMYKDGHDSELNTDNRLRIRMDAVREGAGGEGVYKDYEIHPQTGLILREWS